MGSLFAQMGSFTLSLTYNQFFIQSLCAFWWYVCKKKTWAQRVGIKSQLPLISVFSTDLKRIITPHWLFWDLVAEKSFTIRWSGCRVQVHIQVQGPACHLAITPEGYSRRQSKALTENSRAELLGQHYCTAWAGQNGKHKHRVFPNGQQSLWAATC